MDRAVLSDPAVVTASRDFVCVRLATYENAEEAEFLRSIYRSPRGQDVNTVFALLTPGGEPATRTGRSPGHAFGTSGEETVARLLEEMKDLAERYPGRDVATLSLPAIADLRLALNIAACELQPVLALVGSDAKAVDELEARVSRALWRDSLAGRFALVAVSGEEELEPFGLRSSADGSRLLVLAPDAYGRSATVEAEIPAAALEDGDPDLDGLEARLVGLLRELEPEARDSRSHVRSGKRAGIEWETLLPVTDGPQHVPTGGSRDGSKP